jgi:hypothetical protein
MVTAIFYSPPLLKSRYSTIEILPVYTDWYIECQPVLWSKSSNAAKIASRFHLQPFVFPTSALGKSGANRYPYWNTVKKGIGKSFIYLFTSMYSTFPSTQPTTLQNTFENRSVESAYGVILPVPSQYRSRCTVQNKCRYMQKPCFMIKYLERELVFTELILQIYIGWWFTKLLFKVPSLSCINPLIWICEIYIIFFRQGNGLFLVCFACFRKMQECLKPIEFAVYNKALIILL